MAKKKEIKEIYLVIQKRRQEDGSYRAFNTRYYHNKKKALQSQEAHTGWRGCHSRSYFKADLLIFKLSDTIKGKVPTEEQFNKFIEEFNKCSSDDKHAFGWDVKY